MLRPEGAAVRTAMGPTVRLPAVVSAPRATAWGTGPDGQLGIADDERLEVTAVQTEADGRTLTLVLAAPPPSGEPLRIVIKAAGALWTVDMR